MINYKNQGKCKFVLVCHDSKNSMRNLLIILFSTILISCDEKNQNNPEKIEIDLNESKESFLSEKFEDIEYILLDYQDSLPIVQPYSIIFHKDLIFVNDRILENLFVFSSNGKVLKVIKSTGTGPKEFIYELIDNLIL
jgi:hypothetical protein